MTEIQQPPSAKLSGAMIGIPPDDDGATEALIDTPDERSLTPVTTILPVQTVLPASRVTRMQDSAFPHPPRAGSSTVPTTIENLEYLLGNAGILVRSDVIKKRIDMRWSNGDPVSVSELLSLASLHGLSTGLVETFVGAIAARNLYNPAKEWIESKSWDGIDRLPAFYETVVTTEDYPASLKDTLLYRWMLSVTAAAVSKADFRTRGVLTLQGAQGIGKTRWIAALVPPGPLRNGLVRLDHQFDGGNKDAILGAIGHLIVEFGEVEGMFKGEIAKLKSFITNDCDKVRLPYGHVAMEFERRTVFAATVNDEAFLTDRTGNSRWFTIAVDKLDFEHEIDMQQVYAQLAVELVNDAQHWLTSGEDQMLAAYNLKHRSTSAIGERVRDLIEGGGDGTPHTPTEILRTMGVHNPSNIQCKECGAVLRELLGPSKRINGRDKWRIPEKACPSYRDGTDINNVY